jgi:hypothetical protein
MEDVRLGSGWGLTYRVVLRPDPSCALQHTILGSETDLMG